MKLVTFSVSKYRSITRAYKLPLGEYTVLVGPNNEGKSNILRAMGLALALLSRGRFVVPRRRMLARYPYRETQRFDYQWDRDFPVPLQQAQPGGQSHFTLEFELTPEELHAFNALVGGNLASNLKIKLSLGSEGGQFEVLLKGRGKRFYTERIELIGRFVADHVLVQYIPAIRTSRLVIDVVEEMIARELGQLENNLEYVQLVGKLEAAQEPVLKRISAELTKTISSFVPVVKEVSVENREGLLRAVRTSCRVLVNDGAMTDLELKGDGVKSLIAISLLRHTTQSSLGSKSLILAIEEPESHLHPDAVHNLRGVLQDISQSHQVILATHSTALVERTRVERNILVQGGKARSAKQLSEVRASLGVTLADNLAGAYNVLLVEGEEDEQLLRAYLSRLSKKLRAAIADGVLAFDNLGGASNLSYKASLYTTVLCNVFAFMDNDQAGRQALSRAIEGGSLAATECKFALCRGMPQSELEDLLVLQEYADRVRREFGVELRCRFMHTSQKKWSERVRDCFEEQGVPWSAQTERQVKRSVCDEASKNIACLNQSRRGPIDALVQALEERLPN